MSIPNARIRLEGIAKEMEQRALCGRSSMALRIREVIEEEMFREPPGKPVSRRKLPALTDEQKRLIIKQAELRPDMSLLEIANMFGTNPGRVSEAINGKV